MNTIMHRLSSIGRELYDRVMHRGSPAPAEDTQRTDHERTDAPAYRVVREFAPAPVAEPAPAVEAVAEAAPARPARTLRPTVDDLDPIDDEDDDEDADDEVESVTQVEIAQDLASIDDARLLQGDDLALLDIDELAQLDEDDDDASLATDVEEKDDGDLYGVHVGAASDRDQLDDDAAFDAGQNWIESLQTHAAEGGPEPEQEVDIVDERDLVTSSADSKDRPIADRGSAGPRGL